MKQSTLDTVTAVLFLIAAIVAISLAAYSLNRQQRQFEQLRELEQQMDESDRRRKAVDKELEDAIDANLKKLEGKL